MSLTENDKGNPAVRRARKTRGLTHEAAQLPKEASMSRFSRLLALGAAVTAVAVVPAGDAVAKERASVKSVSAHSQKADKALTRMHNAINAGNQRAAVKQLKAARSESAIASKYARRMAKGASGQQAVDASKSLTIAAGTYDELLEQLAALVDKASGQVQALIAQALNPSLAGREKLVAMLTSMLDRVPAEAKPILASVIAALSAGDSDEVTELGGALATPGLPIDIKGLVQTAFDTANAAITAGFDTVKSLIPMLPPMVAGPLTSVINLVQSTVGTIVPSVLDLCTGIIDTVLGSLPFVGTAGAGFGLGGLLSGILGPQKPAGDSGAAAGGAGGLGGLTSILNGLLGSVTSGVSGGLNSITGLLNNLLGGFLGGARA